MDPSVVVALLIGFKRLAGIQATDPPAPLCPETEISGRCPILAGHGTLPLHTVAILLLKGRQDLVFIEEAFERLLLDYDRVFSAMGVPACLWRRTGEIYKGNREFCELVGLDGAMMREVCYPSYIW